MVPKILVGLLWLWAIAAVLVPTLPGASYGVTVLAILAGVHIIECLVFLPRMKRAGGSLGNHVFQTFLFGFAHLLTLPADGEPSA